MDLAKLVFTLIIMILGIIVVLLVSLHIFGPQAETSLTELYFVGKPSASVDQDNLIQFSFAIHNLEHTEIAYTYIITHNSIIIDHGSTILKHDESAIITKDFVIKSIQATSPVSVQLLNKELDIHFWVNSK